MRRRDFIALTGASVIARSLGARAQTTKIARIGAIHSNGVATFGPFREALRVLGYVEGQNAVFEIRDAAGKLDLLPGMAAELVRLKVDVIIAGASAGIAAAIQATREIPIVMGGSFDPVERGFIASLAHPGGNVTGFVGAPGGAEVKLLDIFHQMRPAARRVAVLTIPADPGQNIFLDPIVLAGQAAGITIQPIFVRGGDPLDEAFAAMVREGAEAVIVNPALVSQNVTEQALRHKIPSFAAGGILARGGGLMGYNDDPDERAAGIASYVDLVLKGAKPADLAVQQATKIDLTINMKTAKAIGFDIPASALVRATELIE